MLKNQTKHNYELGMIGDNFKENPNLQHLNQ